MKVLRKTEVDTCSFKIGDQIALGKYTATCQAISEDVKTATFLLDQYLDEVYQMNSTNTIEGGYLGSELRKNLNMDLSTDNNFDSIRDCLIKDKNGDFFRIPTIDELFDGHSWPLMNSDKKNRMALRQNDYEWGWLQDVVSAPPLAFVNSYGCAYYTYASHTYLGVRPAFAIGV